MDGNEPGFQHKSVLIYQELTCELDKCHGPRNQVRDPPNDPGQGSHPIPRDHLR